MIVGPAVFDMIMDLFCYRADFPQWGQAAKWLLDAERNAVASGYNVPTGQVDASRSEIKLSWPGSQVVFEDTK